MTPTAIEDSLTKAETAVREGQGLSGTGFWGAVTTVKRQPELVDRYADRIAAIDTRAHRNWALFVVPLWLGTLIMIAGTLVGVALVGWAYSLEGIAAVVAFGAGVIGLLVTTHGLAHLLVGWAVGIRFTSWFIGTIGRPQPGVKVDYSSYLRTAPRKRAWMHAAGAIATKLVPFVFLGAAIAADLPGWVFWALVVLGVGQVVTDLLWSTKSSDWMKFKREMSFTQ